MHKQMVRLAGACILVPGIFLWTPGLWAVEEHEQIAAFQEEDIRNRLVDLESVHSDLVVLFFFSPSAGEDIARRLRSLQGSFGEDKLYIAAVGLEGEEDALKHFADRFQIEYYVVPNTERVSAEERYGPFTIRPVTFIVTADRILLDKIIGGGSGARTVITNVARKFLERQQAEDAEKAADIAVQEGEDEKAAKETKAYALVSKGDHENAEIMFAEMDSAAGRAAIALDRGDVDEAIRIAREAADSEPYAATILGNALMKKGDLPEAEKAFAMAKGNTGGQAEWQLSEAHLGFGRIVQEEGDIEAAMEEYRTAHRANYYNVAALSNTAAAQREQADADPEGAVENLQEAQESIERAQHILADMKRQDALVGMMANQIATELRRKNDLERIELRQKLIKDLGEKYRQMKEEGRDKPVDPWTSRPMVVAFLDRGDTPDVFFERAGTALALRREVEMRLDAMDRLDVVDRDILEAVLQELQLGSGDLASDETRLELGQLFAAAQFGELTFTRLGDEPRLNVRMISTETTRLANQFAEPVQDDLDALVDGIVERIAAGLKGDQQLRGRVAGEPEGDELLVGLGGLWDVKPGMRFAVILEGEPVTVGGREVPGEQEIAGEVEITEVVNEYLSRAKVISLNDGVTLEPDTKLVEIPED